VWVAGLSTVAATEFSFFFSNPGHGRNEFSQDFKSWGIVQSELPGTAFPWSGFFVFFSGSLGRYQSIYFLFEEKADEDICDLSYDIRG
jgi:hypothetical protein